MVQDRNIVIMEDQQEIICGLSNGTKFNDLEWLWSHFCCFKPF